MVYRSIYKGRMEYGLTESTLEPRDYHSIESPAIRALLPKLGYNCSAALPIIHGPYKLGSIGLQDLYLIQGTKKELDSSATSAMAACSDRCSSSTSSGPNMPSVSATTS
jgi:hypothetical protein